MLVPILKSSCVMASSLANRRVLRLPSRRDHLRFGSKWSGELNFVEPGGGPDSRAFRARKIAGDPDDQRRACRLVATNGERLDPQGRRPEMEYKGPVRRHEDVGF